MLHHPVRVLITDSMALRRGAHRGLHRRGRSRGRDRRTVRRRPGANEGHTAHHEPLAAASGASYQLASICHFRIRVKLP
jgi:hypothetical protein